MQNINYSHDHLQGRRNRFSLGGARIIRKMTFCEFSKILLFKCSILGGGGPGAPRPPRFRRPWPSVTENWNTDVEFLLPFCFATFRTGQLKSVFWGNNRCLILSSIVYLVLRLYTFSCLGVWWLVLCWCAIQVHLLLFRLV